MKQPHRILLAEDDVQDAELTLEALSESHLAEQVCVVHDGEEALNYLFRRGKFETRLKGNPVVILLDLKLPKIDGLEVLEKIKSDSDLKKIPVVILTSSKMEKDIIESYKKGANAYVVKPVGFKEFSNTIKNLGTFWARINEPPIEI